MENAYTLESTEVFQKAWNTGKKAKSKSEVLGLSFSFTTSGKSVNHFETQFSHLEVGIITTFYKAMVRIK